MFGIWCIAWQQRPLLQTPLRPMYRRSSNRSTRHGSKLPPELRPKWWRQKFVKPVVLLVRALYGHPDAGGLWEEHLKKVLKSLGGSEVHEYPGNFYFKDTGLLLSTYVDDLTLSGPSEQHKPFWDKLTSLVNVEPPEPIYRILGRNHVNIGLTSEGIFTKDKKLVSHSAMAFDMSDYAQQTVDLYKSIAKIDSQTCFNAFCTRWFYHTCR